MNRYYFSGIDRVSFFEILAREGAAGMVNAQIATQPAMTAAYERWPEIPLALDSGAFQGVTDVDWYANVVRQIGDRFDWVANLDVIGDQAASDRNWEALHSQMINALWVYQVNGGRQLGYMASVAEVERFIGVGGLVPVMKLSVQRAMDLIGEIGRWLERSGARAHFFGVSSPLVLAEFAGEEWFASADSQTWLSGFKSRELLARDGGRLKCEQLGIELSREECAAQNVRQIHTWMSGRPIQFAML